LGRKQIYIILILGFYSGFSQERKTVSFGELNFEFNKDTTLVKVKKADKYLNGKYKMIVNPKKDEYSFCEFQDGKLVGLKKSFRNGILTGTTEFENRMKNGYDIVYDQTGKHMMWKTVRERYSKTRYSSPLFLSKDIYYKLKKHVATHIKKSE